MSETRNVEVCPCCGHKTVVYKHKLNEVLVAGLKALHAAGGSATVRELSEAGAPYSVTANFQKLRYFGLVEKHGRVYSLTSLGSGFLTGAAAAPAWAQTKNGEAFEWGPAIAIGEVALPVQDRGDFEEQAGL